MKLNRSGNFRHFVACQLLLMAIAVTCGCDRERSKETTSGSRLSRDVATAKISEDTFAVLFIGNSHSAPIPKILTSIFERRHPDLKVHFRTPPGSGFLVDHLEKPGTMELVRQDGWDYVVLQAQKYSTSGKFTYSTDAAMQFCDMAKQNGAKVIMYPEWSRRDFPDEYQRIRKIHDSIADKTGARVAPIGEAWSLASTKADIDLYQFDGNHASFHGSYLNACVFYSMLMEESPEITDGDELEEDSQTLRQLESIGWSGVKPMLTQP